MNAHAQVNELNFDKDIPEENPELVAIDHEFLPDEPARVRIAIRYAHGCAARMAVRMGQVQDNSKVTEFMDEAASYTGRALRKRSYIAPYNGVVEDVKQDFFVACIELLDREKPLCAQPTCCVGTQIYNHLMWGVSRLAKLHHVPDERTHVGSEALETLEIPGYDPDPNQRVYEKEAVQRIAKKYGPQALMWIRGRYFGNGYQQLQAIMGLPDSRCQLFEDLMQRIAKIDR